MLKLLKTIQIYQKYIFIDFHYFLLFLFFSQKYFKNGVENWIAIINDDGVAINLRTYVVVIAFVRLTSIIWCLTTPDFEHGLYFF